MHDVLYFSPWMLNGKTIHSTSFVVDFLLAGQHVQQGEYNNLRTVCAPMDRDFVLFCQTHTCAYPFFFTYILSFCPEQGWSLY
jgi:hypothetical protein